MSNMNKDKVAEIVKSRTNLDAQKRQLAVISATSGSNEDELDRVSQLRTPGGKYLALRSLMTNFKEVDVNQLKEKIISFFKETSDDVYVGWEKDANKLHVDHPLLTVEIELDAMSSKTEDGVISFIVIKPWKSFGVIEAYDLWNDISDEFYSEDADKAFKEAARGTDRDGEKIHHVNFTALSFINGNPDTTSSKFTTDDFKDVRYDFYPKINVPALMHSYVKGDSSVLILLGPPGTGKTSLMRRALADLAIEKDKDINVVYIKDPDILMEDAIYNKLTQLNPEFILLDDMDQGLQDRRVSETAPGKGDGNPLMNKLLSFTNGVIKSDIKVVITTNRDCRDKMDIDSALVRQGRCHDVVRIPELDWSEALDLWCNHYGRPADAFKKLFPKEDATIPQSMLAHESQLFGEFGDKSYLLDPSLSAREFFQDDTIVPERCEPVTEIPGKKQSDVGRGLVSHMFTSRPILN